MPNPEEQERRLKQGELECKANHLAHFVLGLLSKGKPDGPQTKVVQIASKDWQVLEATAYALVTGEPYILAELSTPSGALCRTYKPRR